MTWIIPTILLLAAALGQIMLPGIRGLAGSRWPLLACVVVFYALHRKGAVVLAIALVAGIVQDALSIVPLGYSACLFCVAALPVSLLRRLVVPDSPITAAVFCAVVCMTVTGLLGLLLAASGLHECGFGVGLVRALGTGLLGCASGPVVFLVAGGLHQSVDRLEERESPNEVA